MEGGRISARQRENRWPGWIIENLFRGREKSGDDWGLDAGPVEPKILPRDKEFFIRRLDSGIRGIRVSRA